jgi:hypothetical protein
MARRGVVLTLFVFIDADMRAAYYELARRSHLVFHVRHNTWVLDGPYRQQGRLGCKLGEWHQRFERLVLRLSRAGREYVLDQPAAYIVPEFGRRRTTELSMGILQYV